LRSDLPRTPRSGRVSAVRLGLPALALLALAVVGCDSPRVSMVEAPRTFTEGDYGGIYGRWTRSADEFDFGHLGEVIHVTATFESWEFRWAYVVRYAHDHSFTTEERTHLLEETLEDSRDRHRFFVTLGLPIYREADLTGALTDIRVLLVEPSGRQFEPVELTRISRGAADQRRYFPSIHRQRHIFRIAFPVIGSDGAPTIPHEASHVLLRFASAAGTVDLRWELEASTGGDDASDDVATVAESDETEAAAN
jgi:hypothetical protein